MASFALKPWVLWQLRVKAALDVFLAMAHKLRGPRSSRAIFAGPSPTGVDFEQAPIVANVTPMMLSDWSAASWFALCTSMRSPTSHAGRPGIILR